MKSKISLMSNVKRIGTGLSLLLFPLIFVFSFAVHPNLLHPKILSPQELINRAHNANLLHFAHVLVTLSTGLLIVVAIHFMNLQKDKKTEWYGFAGGVLAILGALMLAADKGAFCLTMSALDKISKENFNNMMPGLLAIFGKEGWLILTWGLIFLPIGFFIQTIGLIKSKSFPTCKSVLFIIGVLFISTPDGVEIVNLSAAILFSIALIPYGIMLIRNKEMIILN